MGYSTLPVSLLELKKKKGTNVAVDSFLPILIFKQTDGPQFRKGFPSILAFALVAIVLIGKNAFLLSHMMMSNDHTALTDYLHKRELKQKAGAALASPPSEAIVHDDKEL